MSHLALAMPVFKSLKESMIGMVSHNVMPAAGDEQDSG